MAPPPKYVVSPEVPIQVTDLLNQAQIPCCLWGNLMLSVLGASVEVRDADFIVPDQQAANAAVVLVDNNFKECKMAVDDCPKFGPLRGEPRPARHFFLGDGTHTGEDSQTVNIWAHRSLLGHFPEIPRNVPSRGVHDHPYISAAHETLLPPHIPGRCIGRLENLFVEGWTVNVITFKPTPLIEHLLMLLSRDIDRRPPAEHVWRFYLSAILEAQNYHGMADVADFEWALTRTAWVALLEDAPTSFDKTVRRMQADNIAGRTQTR
ncbi:hypothetical protein BDW42DRAFT_198352 [Aspergillus taichungensis]|uniref:Uncharacterized protein n=1 Tax=Aspergillus taichungensis TaxID=482145 RepID=A0A2J5IA07_9EURO|nr:hypothetical protein BDW42DRAFT_198352 [Aspergillus taichungensis]